MRIVVIGASGNCGTALLRALVDEPAVNHILGIARRRPDLQLPGVEWHTADIAVDDLEGPMRGADCVVHLAWLIQPSRDHRLLDEVNVLGSARVFDAVAAARVPSLVYASSVGTYSPGPYEHPVDESWPVEGIAPNHYSLQKAAVERRLDVFEARNPGIRTVRLRPALVFQRAAASGIRRLFAGPLMPSALARPGMLPVAPTVRGMTTQCVHATDLADAYRRVIVDPRAQGAYNVAASQPLDTHAIQDAFRARATVGLPAWLVRPLIAATWRARLQPTPASWLDVALETPLMSSRRIREELGWAPRWSSAETLRDLLEGMADAAGEATPPLDPATSGPARSHEFATGVGGRV